MRHDKHAVVALIVTASSATAIAQQKTAPQPEVGIDESPDTEESVECPEALRGVDLSLHKLDAGVSLEFTTKKKDQLEPLRHTMREVATLIEHHSKLAALHPELVEKSSEMVSIPAVDIDVRDIKTGVRIIVRPENPGELGLVRAQADELKELWDENACIQGKAPAQTTIENVNI